MCSNYIIYTSSRVHVRVGVCVCVTLGFTGNLSVWSRGVWHSRPTSRNEAVGESGQQGLISPAYLLHYLGKQEEMVLDTLVCVGAFPSVFL